MNPQIPVGLLGRPWRWAFDLPWVDSDVETPFQGDIVSKKHPVGSTLPFQDVLHDAILPYAFSASCFPLILSIENHCNKEQQDRMAEHFKDILGELLYTAPVDTSR